MTCKYDNEKNTFDSIYPELFPVDFKPYNLSYGVWTAKWWQWAVSIPISNNPLLDNTGKHCMEGQEGPVWFLAGTAGKTYSSKRTCTIPSGKCILFPIIASEFSFAEYPSLKNEEELISSVAVDIDRWSLLEATVDGVQLQNLDKYRVKYGPFELILPTNNIWNVMPCSTKAVSDGFWVFLKPLKDGNHNITFSGIEPNFRTKVTYQIVVDTQKS